MADPGTDVIDAAKNLTQGPIDTVNAVKDKAASVVSSAGDAIVSGAKSVANYFTPDPIVSANDLAYANRKQQENDDALGRQFLTEHPELAARPPAPAGAPTGPGQNGIPTAEQEALQAPSVDPTFVAADALTAGGAGLLPAAKAAAQSAFFQGVQTHAAKLTGLATDNPYVKAVAGIAAPILLSVLAHRATEGAPAPGTTLADTTEGTATIAPPPAGAPERPTGLTSVLTPEGAPPAGAAAPLLNSQASGAPRKVTPELVAGPSTISDTAKVANEPAPLAPGSQAARDFLNAHDEALPDVGDLAQAASGKDENSTPTVAAQTLAEKQIEALKAARVGTGAATKFGRPDIATVIPEDLTAEEGQQLRASLEPPIPGQVKPTNMAAHVAALSQTYGDEIKGLIAQNAEIVARDKGGEDTAADTLALQNRAAAFALNYANLPGAYSDAARAVEMGNPMKPDNALAMAGAKLAQQFDFMRDPDQLKQALASLTPEGSVQMLRQIGETVQSGGSIINDGISSYYKASLLTSPETYVRIPIDNAITTLAEIPTRAMAGVFSNIEQAMGLGGAGPEGNVSLREPLYMLKGLKDSFRSAVDYAAVAAKTGVRYGAESDSPYINGPEVSRRMGNAAQAISSPLGKLMSTWIGDAVDYMGTPLNLVQHGLAGVHTFGYLMAQGAEMHALAWRFGLAQAAQEGLSGAEGIARATEHYQTLINEKPTDLINASKPFADLVTMATALGPNGQALQKLTQVPGLNVVAPFFKVMANQLKYDTQYVGSGLLSANMYKSGAIGQIYRGRLALGALMSVITGYEVARGNITGSLSYLTPTGRQMADKQNILPYAFKVGDSYVEMPPLLKQSVGIIADACERAHHMDEQSAGSYTWAALNGVMHSLTSTSVMLGVKHIMDAIENPDAMSEGASMEKYAGQTLSGFFPASGLLKGIARATNSVQRNTDADPTHTDAHLEGLRKSLMAQFPLLQDELGPSYDVLGQPIMRRPGVLDNMVWPIQITKQNLDPKEQAIQGTGANFAKPPKYISGSAPKPFQDPNDPDIGVPLSIEQQDEWAKARGENLSRLMDMKMASPMWENGSRELKKQMLEQAGAKAETDATTMLRITHPELVMQAMERKLSRRSALMTPADATDTGDSDSAAAGAP
jgi:hypothetical protein